eukprot:COSAG01_NODE_45648_length_407_cov_1.490260_1_plen_135_part_11
MNEAAKLSTHSKMNFMAVYGSLGIVSAAARDQGRRKSLVASGVANALLWTIDHDHRAFGTSLAAKSVSAAVTLIGRNEGGLTLTRETVDVVCRMYHFFWDTTDTDYRSQRDSKAPLSSIIGKAMNIVDVVIADAN